jgi:hypothetical protein
LTVDHICNNKACGIRVICKPSRSPQT